MSILDGSVSSSIAQAAEVLRQGGLAAFPTETVYGLGGDAFNPRAVADIFALKDRPRFDPLIVHIGHAELLDDLAGEISPLVRLLTKRFWPGPLTVIVPKKPVIPGIVTAGLPTVGIRMPSHPVALALLNAFGGPIAAPSANPFGYVSPTRAQFVEAMFGTRAPLILDGGDTTFGVESTIVSVFHETLRIHRYGGITMEELQAVWPAVERYHHSAGDPLQTPGALPYHYAPRKPLFLVESPEDIVNRRSAYLAFRRPSQPVPALHLRILSASGNLREAAAGFFSALIELDNFDIDCIYAEKVPEEGLGRAMMERLRKAAAKPYQSNR